MKNIQVHCQVSSDFSNYLTIDIKEKMLDEMKSIRYMCTKYGDGVHTIINMDSSFYQYCKQEGENENAARMRLKELEKMKTDRALTRKERKNAEREYKTLKTKSFTAPHIALGVQTMAGNILRDIEKALDK